jgi:hypothetical protein
MRETYTTLGFQTRMILNRLRNASQLSNNAGDKKEERESDSRNLDSAKRDPKENREYVERRLKELAEWERKLRNPKLRG